MLFRANNLFAGFRQGYPLGFTAIKIQCSVSVLCSHRETLLLRCLCAKVDFISPIYFVHGSKEGLARDSAIK